MLFLYLIPVGLLIGFAAGGRLSGLGKLRLRWMALLLPALLIQVLVFPSFSSRAILPYATAPLHILSYALLALWIAGNLKLRPILALGLGAACNLLVLVANGGFMPASTAALEKAGLSFLAQTLVSEGTYSNLIRMSADTHLNFLGDILFVPRWIPFSSAFSIGDVLILLALTWLIVKGMRIDGKRTGKTA